VTLPSDTEILITRELDAPRRLVYRAWTTGRSATPSSTRGWEVGKQEQMDQLEELARSLR
jgi:hypothetical protein